MNFKRMTFLAAGALSPLFLAGGEPRDFIEFLPSCKRHYVDNDKLNNRTWERAWTIRDERFNDVTNLFLDIDHPETFPRELFDSATSAGAVRGCFGWGKNAVDPRFAEDVEPCTGKDEQPAKIGVKKVAAERLAGMDPVRLKKSCRFGF